MPICPWDEPFIQKIIKKVKVGEEQPLLDAIAEFTEKLAGSKDVTAAVPDSHYGADHGAVAFPGLNNKINLEDVFGGNGDVYTRAMQLESTDALRRMAV